MFYHIYSADAVSTIPMPQSDYRQIIMSALGGMKYVGALRATRMQTVILGAISLWGAIYITNKFISFINPRTILGELVIDVDAKCVLSGNNTKIEFYSAYLEGQYLDSKDPNFRFQGPIKSIAINVNNKKHQVVLRQELQERLLAYLIKGKDQCCAFDDKMFDCGRFVRYLNNTHASSLTCPGAPFALYKEVSERFDKVQEGDRVEPGDSVYFKKPGTNQFHYALHLGQGIYVSKFGSFGIFFTDLENMQKYFGYGDQKGFEIDKVVTTKQRDGSGAYNFTCQEGAYAEYAALFSCDHEKPLEKWLQVKTAQTPKELDEYMQQYLKSAKVKV